MTQQERVFISYSRRDGVFARRLYDQLSAEGFTSWADWEGLSYSVEWWEEIKRAIERCENFLCVLTPVYFMSRPCNDELAYALSLGKRIIPVVRREFKQGGAFIKEVRAELFGKPWAELAEANTTAISAINYHFFLKKDGFDCIYDEATKRVINPENDGPTVDISDFTTSFQKLHEDIVRDPAHVSAHTRLTVRAVEWGQNAQSADFLLLGDDLKRAEVWLESWTELDKEGRTLAPEPTDLHREYITASAQERERLQEEDRAQQARELALQRQAAERQRVAANRLRYLLGGAIIFVIVSAALAGFATVQQGIAQDEARRADDNAERADARAAEAQSIALAADAQRALTAGDADLALALALEAVNIPGADPSTINALRDALDAPATRRVFDIPQGITLNTLQGIVAEDRLNPFQEGGALPASVVTLQAEGRATLQANLDRLNFSNGVFVTGAEKIVLSADGNLLIAANTQKVYAWDAATGRLRWSYPTVIEATREAELRDTIQPLSITLGGLTISNDGQRILVGEEWSPNDIAAVMLMGGLYEAATPPIPEGSYLVSIDIQTGLEIERTTAPARPQNIVRLPDGTAFLNLYESGIGYWDGENVRTLPTDLAGAEQRLIEEMVATEDGLMLVTAHSDQTVRVWDVAGLLGGDPVYQMLPRGEGVVLAMAVSSDKRLAIGGFNGVTEVWDLVTLSRSWRLQGGLSSSLSATNSMTFSFDGRWLAVGSGSGGIVIRDAENGAPVTTLSGQDKTIRALVYTPDGQTLYSGGDDDQLRAWDLRGGGAGLRQSLEADANGGGPVIFSPDGTALAGAMNGKLIIWDTATQQIRYQLEDQPDLFGLTYSPDGTDLLTWSLGGGKLILRDAATGQPKTIYKQTHGAIYQAAYSPDGTRIATTEYSVLHVDSSGDVTFLSTGLGNAVVVRDAQTLEELVVINIPQASFDVAWAVAFSPDGKQVLLGTFDGYALLYDAQTGELVRDYGEVTSEFITQVAFSPDGTRILVIAGSESASVYRTETGRLLAELGEHTGLISEGAFSPDGLTVVTGSEDETIILWDMSDARMGSVIRRLNVGTAVSSVTFALDGRTVAYSDTNGDVHLWRGLPDLDDMLRWMYANRWLRPLTCGERSAYRLALQCAADGSQPTPTLNAVYITPTPPNTLTPTPDLTQITGTPTPIPTDVPSPLSIVYGVRWIGDGERVATTNDDGTVRVWDVATGQQRVMIEGLNINGAVNTYVSPDQMQLLVYAFDDGAALFDVMTGEKILSLPHEASVEVARWSPDGTTIASGASDGSLTLWDAQTGQPIWRKVEHSNRVYWLEWSPDGTLIGTTSDDGTARIWTTDGEVITVFEGHSDEVGDLRWSSDGVRVCTASNDQTAQVWDAQTAEVLTILEGHTGWAIRCLWSADDMRLATSGFDGTARLWDAQTGQAIAVIEGYEPFAPVNYSPDGTMLAVSGYSSGGLALYDSVTGEHLRTMPVEGIEQIGLLSPFWSSDGSKLAVGGRNGRFYLWTLADDTVIRFPQADSFIPTPTPNPAQVTPRPSHTPTPVPPLPPLLTYGVTEGIMPIGKPVVWRFEARRGEMVSMTSESEFGVEFEILDADGRLLLTGTDIRFFTLNSDQSIEPWPAPYTGTYLVRVQSQQGDGGAYRLILSSSVNSTPTPTSEPLDGQTIGLGIFDGNLEFATGQRFTYQGLPGTALRIEVRAEFDIELWVYSADGTLLAENDDAPGLGLDALIESVEIPADGELHIVVRSWNNREMGGFTLSVTPSIP